jgi:hypothetical protein
MPTIDEILKQDDADIAKFRRRYDKAIDGMSISVGGLQPVSIGDAQQQINTVFQDSGYYEVINQQINSEYQKIIEQEIAGLEDIVGRDVIFQDKTRDALMAQKEIDLAQWNELVNNTQNKLAVQTYQFSLGNISKKQLIASLTDTFDQFKSWTRTWADTSISGFKRTAFMNIAEDAGIEKFKYIGPQDALTRPFCSAHVGQVKTAKEWNEFNDDPLRKNQPDPVTSFLGGFNCRHRLVAVV